ncbi:MAG: NAD-dependent deacylase [Candidatus Marinimicrobia bacterium]|nr:NAD-dependent deacylase [Candidatus Neomarinimicrobiota bacterium]
MEINTININIFKRIIFFTGAGMSAESGVPTYRGEGGVWREYNWQEYACQEAWELNPEKVFDFHDLRREEALKCFPHKGHDVITALQKVHPNVVIVTQNIDGMHQRAGSENVIELHGSIWRIRCDREDWVKEDLSKGPFSKRKCDCGAWLRPDIIWFSDMLDPDTVQQADEVISKCDLFISIGTSGVVWPAAGYPQLAKSSGAMCIEVNPKPSEQAWMVDHVYKGKAGELLPLLFQV